jgi:restriction system protein
MTVPDYQTLMLPLLPLLREAARVDAETQIAAVANELAQQLGLTQDDLAALLPSGRQSVFLNRLHWAKSYMQRAGLLESTRHGCFRVTDRGRSLLAEKMLRIDNKILSRFPEFVEWRVKSSSPDHGEEAASENADLPEELESPEDQIEAGYKKISDALASDLIDRVHAAPPIFFEKLIVDLLVAMGYGGGRGEAGKALGKSGDGGVDGVINEDELGLDAVYIQAKRYAPTSPVPVREVRDFVGSLEGFRASKGVFVTTSSFPASAIEFASKVSKRIVLIDGKQLARLMLKHNIGVRKKDVYEIKAIDEDYFSE